MIPIAHLTTVGTPVVRSLPLAEYIRPTQWATVGDYEGITGRYILIRAGNLVSAAVYLDAEAGTSGADSSLVVRVPDGYQPAFPFGVLGGMTMRAWDQPDNSMHWDNRYGGGFRMGSGGSTWNGRTSRFMGHGMWITAQPIPTIEPGAPG